LAICLNNEFGEVIQKQLGYAIEKYWQDLNLAIA